jgi:hypothetical protein
LQEFLKKVRRHYKMQWMHSQRLKKHIIKLTVNNASFLHGNRRSRMHRITWLT